MTQIRKIRAEASANSWLVREDELAVRVQIEDLQGYFAKALTVEPGSRALVCKLGLGHTNAVEYGPGRYTLDTFMERLVRLGEPKKIDVIVCRQGEFVLTLTVPRLHTKEYLCLDATVQIGLQVGDLGKFVSSLMRDRDICSKRQITFLLMPWLREALYLYVHERDIREVYRNREGLRAALDEVVKGEPKGRLEQLGLVAGTLRTIEVGHKEYDANNEERAQRWLSADANRNRLEERKAFDELYDENERRKLACVETDHQRRQLSQELKRQGIKTDLADRLERIGMLEDCLNANWDIEKLKSASQEKSAELEYELEKRADLRSEEGLELAHKNSLAERERNRQRKLADLETEKALALARAAYRDEQNVQSIQRRIKFEELRTEADDHRTEINLKRQLLQAEATRDAALEDANLKRKIHDIEEQIRRADAEFSHEQAIRSAELAEKNALTGIELESLKREGLDESLRRKTAAVMEMDDADHRHAVNMKQAEHSHQESMADRDLRRVEIEANARTEIARAQSDCEAGQRQQFMLSEKDARIADKKEEIERMERLMRDQAAGIRGVVQDMVNAPRHGDPTETQVVVVGGEPENGRSGSGRRAAPRDGAGKRTSVCPNCKGQNPEGQKYCNCGHRLF